MKSLFDRPGDCSRSWADATEGFLGKYSASSARAYGSALRLLGDELGHPALSALDAGDVQSAAERRFASSSESVLGQRWSALRRFVAYCIEQGYLIGHSVDPELERRRQYKAEKAREYRDPSYIPKSMLPRHCGVDGCTEKPLPSLLVCRAHRNERAQLVRQQGRESGRPCLWDDCTEPREQFESQEASYCAEHQREERLEYQRLHPAVRSAPTLEVRACALALCELTFEWSSAQPRQRFCSTGCRTASGVARKKELLPSRDYPVSATEKRCCTCKRTLPADHFYRDRRELDGLAVRCKTDAGKVKQKTLKDNPRSSQRSSIRKRLKSYNIIRAAERLASYEGQSLEDAYDSLVDAQRGVCLWCLQPDSRQTECFRAEGREKVPPSKDVLVIDHDHECCDYGGSCGECVRGLFHRGCNLQLQASMRDIIERVLRVERFAAGHGLSPES